MPLTTDSFRGYYDILDKALDIFPLEVQCSIEFARRGEEHSPVIYIRNDSEEIRKSIDNFLGEYGFTIPRKLYEPGHEGTRTGLIAIDLSTVTTDNLRLYVTTAHNNPNNDKLEWLWGIGYYLDKSGNVLGKKHYNINLSGPNMKVHYFDAEGNLVSSATETETITDDWKVWGGSEQLYNMVKENNLVHQFAVKSKKDQAYFIVSLPTNKRK